MKLVLDNKIICDLYSFLGKKDKSSEMEKIRLEVSGGRLTYAATNGRILGIFSRALDNAETTDKDFCLCIPVQQFGKVSCFKKNTIMLSSDDMENFTLTVGVAEFNFKKETIKFPNFKSILLQPNNREPLTTYRVFNPADLASLAAFMGDGYYQTPYVAKNENKSIPVQFEAENCGQKWTALIMPVRGK